MSNRYYSKWSASKPASSSDWLYLNLDTSREILSLSVTELSTSHEKDLMRLDDLKSVGSYNWSTLNTSNRPTVIIPGRADTLCNPLRLVQLKRSKREQIIDENKHFYPDYPLEPLFRAVKKCSPDFNWSEVSVVTDRNNLRKLLNFVESSAEDSFRVDFQRVGNMIALIRCEEKTREFCDDYGSDFERLCTENGLDQGTKYIFNN